MKLQKYLTFAVSVAIITVAGWMIVNAWTNPAGNPPQGGGALSIVNGYIGIGTSTPSSPLSIFGSVDPLFSLGRQGGTSPAIFKLGIDNALVVNIGSYDTLTLKNGNVGIGVTPTTYKLDVLGNIRGAQFCIGTNCISSWPSSALCTWSSKTYSTGATCYAFDGSCGSATRQQICGGTGAWSSGICGTVGQPVTCGQ